MSDAARKLALSDLLRGPVIEKAIRMLDLPRASRGLDAGRGIGSHTLLLAESVGAGGHVTGLDRSREFLDEAKHRAADSPARDRLSFQHGDELSSEDEAAYRRLCTPESPDCILNAAGYYAFFTYSLFEGRVGVDNTH